MLALAWLGHTHRAHRDDWLRGEGVVAHGERDYRHTPGPVRGDCGGCAGAGVSGGLCARLACLRASLASRSAAISYSPGKED